MSIHLYHLFLKKNQMAQKSHQNNPKIGGIGGQNGNLS
jgi:hypothetical protein